MAEFRLGIRDGSPFGDLGEMPGGVPWTPPAGPVPNNGPMTATIVWVLFGVSSLLLVLRLYCKIYKTKGLWWDDWVMIVSWVCFAVNAALIQAIILLGFGMYPEDINPANTMAIALEATIGTTFGTLAITWSTTSFAISLLRLTQGRLKGLVWAIIVAINVIMIVDAIFGWVQCDPISKIWNPSEQGFCWDSSIGNDYDIFAECFSGAIDVVLALLPWCFLWNLNLKKQEKIGVGIAMSMGLNAAVTAFMKANKVGLIGEDNFTYDGSALYIWTAAQIAATIISSCIPALRVLLRDVGSSAVRHYTLTNSKAGISEDDSLQSNLTPEPVPPVPRLPLNDVESGLVPVPNISRLPSSAAESRPVPVPTVPRPPLSNIEPTPAPVSLVPRLPPSTAESRPVPIPPASRPPLSDVESRPAPVPTVPRLPSSAVEAGPVSMRSSTRSAPGSSNKPLPQVPPQMPPQVAVPGNGRRARDQEMRQVRRSAEPRPLTIRDRNPAGWI